MKNVGRWHVTDPSRPFSGPFANPRLCSFPGDWQLGSASTVLIHPVTAEARPYYASVVPKPLKSAQVAHTPESLAQAANFSPASISQHALLAHEFWPALIFGPSAAAQVLDRAGPIGDPAVLTQLELPLPAINRQLERHDRRLERLPQLIAQHVAWAVLETLVQIGEQLRMRSGSLITRGTP